MAFISPLLLTALLTALTFMLIGYDNGVIGGLTEAKTFNSTFNNPTGSALSTIVAIYEVGCFFGAVGAFAFGEHLGRKKTITVGSILMVIGAALQASAYTRGHLIAGRIVSGLGMGLLNSTAPVLQAEVSPKASRGRYVCAQLSLLNFGIMLAYWLDFGTTRAETSSFAWRFPIAFQIVIIIPIFLLSFIVKESPRWLENHGRHEEALASIAAYKGLEVTDVEAREAYQEIADAVAYEQAVMVKGWKQLFAKDELQSRRRLGLACMIQFCQQLGGINAVIYYGTLVISGSLGFSSIDASVLSGGLFTCFFVMSFVPWLLIDSLGRKPLLVGAVAFMAMCFAILAGATHEIQYKTELSGVMGRLAVSIAFLYLTAFTIGFQATVWCTVPELLPLKIRGKGTALATCCNWIINFAVVEVFPVMIEKIGWKTYIVFGVFNAMFIPLFWFFLVETKGKSLEEIDLLFSPSHATTVGEAKREQIQHNEFAGSESKGEAAHYA